MLEGELEPRLLALLDGTRDSQELACELALEAQQVHRMLARFVPIGLLES